VVDLGVLEVTYNGRTDKKHMIRVVWQIAENMENGKPFTVSRRFNLSLHKKAALRATLEGWRGRAFSDTELMGFDLEKLIGVPCLLTVIHVAHDGSTYANVSAVMRQPSGITAVTPRDYTRSKDRHENGEAGESIAEDDVPAWVHGETQ
jgi:hypothetical protein